MLFSAFLDYNGTSSNVYLASWLDWIIVLRGFPRVPLVLLLCYLVIFRIELHLIGLTGRILRNPTSILYNKSL